jgi:hypothetical protein
VTVCPTAPAVAAGVSNSPSAPYVQLMSARGSSPCYLSSSRQPLEHVRSVCRDLAEPRHRLFESVRGEPAVVLACGHSALETGANYHFRLAARQRSLCHEQDAASKGGRMT